MPIFVHILNDVVKSLFIISSVFLFPCLHWGTPVFLLKHLTQNICWLLPVQTHSAKIDYVMNEEERNKIQPGTETVVVSVTQRLSMNPTFLNLSWVDPLFIVPHLPQPLKTFTKALFAALWSLFIHQFNELTAKDCAVVTGRWSSASACAVPPGHFYIIKLWQTTCWG